MNFLNLFKRQNKEDDFNKYPDATFILASDGRIVDLNIKAIELFGIKYSQMLDKNIGNFVDGGIFLVNKIAAGCIPQIAKTKVGHDTNDRFFEISAMKDPATSLIYTTMRDSTQQYLMQNVVNNRYELAKKIIDEKNNFLIGISGEILSALASVEGFSKALATGVGGVLIDKQMKYVNIINKNANDLTYDLEKLFTLFRLESNKYQFDYRNFDLVNLLNELSGHYEKEFQNKRMFFEHDFSSLVTRSAHLDQSVLEYSIKSILEAFLRETTIGKVTFNVGNPPLVFLENAEFEGKTSPDTNSYVLFEIKANEFVMEEDELSTLFESYALDTKEKRPVGIKLAFVLLKKFIMCLKGEVWVYSKQNFGTMVRFVVPIEKNI